MRQKNTIDTCLGLYRLWMGSRHMGTL